MEHRELKFVSEDGSICFSMFIVSVLLVLMCWLKSFRNDTVVAHWTAGPQVTRSIHDNIHLILDQVVRSPVEPYRA